MKNHHIEPPSGGLWRFPYHGGPSRDGASWWEIALEELRRRIGLTLNWLGVPGLVRPVTRYDRLTNTYIQVRLGGFFTVISVSGKDYYLRRLDGSFDGTEFKPAND